MRTVLSVTHSGVPLWEQVSPSLVGFSLWPRPGLMPSQPLALLAPLAHWSLWERVVYVSFLLKSSSLGLLLGTRT